jgi:hypothetical protein
MGDSTICPETMRRLNDPAISNAVRQLKAGVTHLLKIAAAIGSHDRQIEVYGVST